MEMEKRTNWGLPLPSRIAAAIFSKLPISNLPACRLVSKSWNNLILHYAATSSSSIRKTMIYATEDATSPRSPPRFLNPKLHCFDLDTLSFVASTTLVGPLTEFISIFSVCNGLIFLDNGGVEIGSQSPGIFNPMTHEFFPIPPHKDIYYGFFDGFGFCPRTKQYKLFLVPPCLSQPESECYMKILRFGRNGNEWSNVSFPYPFYVTSHGVCMDGVIYFLGRDCNEFLMTVYALDVDAETFELVAVLDVGARPGRAFLQLFNGTIYAKFFIHESSQVQIWRMQARDSWIKEFTICGNFIGKSFQLLKANDEKIFVRISKNLFWLSKSENSVFEMSTVEMENKIKTLNIPSQGRQCDNGPCICLIETLHFGSLFRILAGDELGMNT